MEHRCPCGNPIVHAPEALVCVRCGQPSCLACGALIDAEMYCDACAGEMLGVEVLCHVGAAER